MTTRTKCNTSSAKSYLEKKALMQLQKIKKGEIIWKNQSETKFGNPYKNLKAEVIIHDNSFYNKFIWRGSLGAAESYMDGDWSCNNLTQLMQSIIENESVLANLEKGWSFAGHAFRILKNIVNYSHIKKSRKNILYHYDLSNIFFKLFLDKKMLYSCAIFDDDLTDLDQAQDRKLLQICESLKLTKDDHLLEIGSGWGALAIYAAQKYKCKVTTTTISDAQYNYVYKKINDLGLKDRVFLEKKDYRQLDGKYDKLVSIEMIESIGYQYFNKYFSVCENLLKPGGLFLLQSITINDQEYDRYKREIDFIKAYIFPGGCLPCIETISSSVKYKTSMRIKEIKDIGKDYAKTLSHWNSRFQKNLDKIIALGFDEKFTRMFEFYFCYCEAAFLSSYISDIHVVMEKKC